MMQPPGTPGQSRDVPYSARLIVWLALVVSIGLYFVVTKIAPPADAQPDSMLVMILLGFAASLVAVSIPVKARFLARATLPSGRLRQQAELIALLLCESAALLGVVVWFVTAWQQYYIFLLLAILGMLLHFPQRGDAS